MIEFLPQNDGNLIALKFVERVEQSEIEALEPMLEVQIEKSGTPILLLIDLLEFEGWGDLHAVWEHFLLVKHHHKHVSRIAVLGDQVWERRFAELAARFGQASVGYYDEEGREEALKWLMRSSGAAAPEA
jgi:hypothetical protein